MLSNPENIEKEDVKVEEAIPADDAITIMLEKQMILDLASFKSSKQLYPLAKVQNKNIFPKGAKSKL